MTDRYSKCSSNYHKGNQDETSRNYIPRQMYTPVWYSELCTDPQRINGRQKIIQDIRPFLRDQEAGLHRLSYAYERASQAL